jgi:hypothetical protein
MKFWSGRGIRHNEGDFRLWNVGFIGQSLAIMSWMSLPDLRAEQM